MSCHQKFSEIKKIDRICRSYHADKCSLLLTLASSFANVHTKLGERFVVPNFFKFFETRKMNSLILSRQIQRPSTCYSFVSTTIPNTNSFLKSSSYSIKKRSRCKKNVKRLETEFSTALKGVVMLASLPCIYLFSYLLESWRGIESTLSSYNQYQNAQCREHSNGK